MSQGNLSIPEFAPQMLTLGCWLAFIVVLFKTIFTRKPKLNALGCTLLLLWLSVGCGVAATEVCDNYAYADILPGCDTL